MTGVYVNWIEWWCGDTEIAMSKAATVLDAGDSVDFFGHPVEVTAEDLATVEREKLRLPVTRAQVESVIANAGWRE